MPMGEFRFSCSACHGDILCDTALMGKDIACPICKAVITVPASTTGTTEVSTTAGTPPPFTGYNATTAQRTSRLAIASLVCSLSSLITCIGWLPGIICGHLAKSRLRRNPALKGKGLATAGLVIGYLILISELGSTAFYAWRVSTAMKHGFENARQELATNNFIVVQTQSATVSNESQSAEPAPGNALVASNQPAESTRPAAAVASPQTEPEPAGWTSDISTVNVPAHPVSGKLRGQDFAARTTSLRSGELRIRSESGMQLDIYRLGNSVEGQSYEVRPNDSDNDHPRVRLTWNEGDAVITATFSKGFGMKLQFGEAIHQIVSGKIYLCLPDTSKSFVAGTFELRLPKPRSRQTP